MNDKKIPFNFTYYALKLLGQNLYTNPWTAVSELVANGIDAKASNIDILLDLSNKSSARIEILDDGCGMSYEDLRDKYTLIGRNKRLDSPKDKTILGRKGIGKLAALYLSPKYYICTKTDNEKSLWSVDISHCRDDEVPSLSLVDDKPSFVLQNNWLKNKSGTLLSLHCVDLHKIGEARLKALPSILADYYLSDIINCKIRMAIIEKPDDMPQFFGIKKNISFSTLYGLFDNTGKNFEKLNEFVYITRPYEMPAGIDDRCKTVKISSVENTTGMVQLKNIQGKLISAAYSLTGWIGIHTSLDSEVLKRSDSNYEKIIYHPNALRLYVRGKLAVDNLMAYLRNTQAFSNYIEGEISFDVLDDDSFEDISTSSREGFKRDDPRIEKLLDIVGKIVTKLISERIDARTKLNELNEKFKLEEKKKTDQLLSKAAEQVTIALTEKTKAEEDAKKERQRSDYIISVSNVKENNILPSMHGIYNLSTREKRKLAAFRKYWSDIPKGAKDLVESIGEINNQILYTSKAVSKSNYLLESVTQQIDFGDFISEYIHRIAKKIYGSKIKFEIIDNLSSRLVVNSSTIELTSIIENLIGNSIKASASEMFIIFQDTAKDYSVTFSDNGTGLSESISDINRIFEFGVTTTDGAGLGLYYIKQYVEQMNGNICAEKNTGNGMSFILSWNK